MEVIYDKISGAGRLDSTTCEWDSKPKTIDDTSTHLGGKAFLESTNSSRQE